MVLSTTRFVTATAEITTKPTNAHTGLVEDAYYGSDISCRASGLGFDQDINRLDDGSICLVARSYAYRITEGEHAGKCLTTYPPRIRLTKSGKVHKGDLKYIRDEGEVIMRAQERMGVLRDAMAGALFSAVGQYNWNI